MNVNQLSADQLEELAQSHLCEHYHEYNPNAAELEGPSYGELADAINIVGLDTLINEYADIEFSPDDFFSTAGQQERSARHYYAIYHPHGIHSPSPRDTLYRYDTAAERAEDTDRVNRQNENMKLMQAVPRTFAKKRFPRAFSRDVIIWRPWTDGDAHFNAPFWRDYEDGTQEYTGRPRNVVFMTYEIRQVDAWSDGDGWIYNDSFNIGSFVTAAQDETRAFYRALARLGIRFNRGTVRAVNDGWIIEVTDRKTGEPLFCAIPQEV